MVERNLRHPKPSENVAKPTNQPPIVGIQVVCNEKEGRQAMGVSHLWKVKKRQHDVQTNEC